MLYYRQRLDPCQYWPIIHPYPIPCKRICLLSCGPLFELQVSCILRPAIRSLSSCGIIMGAGAVNKNHKADILLNVYRRNNSFCWPSTQSRAIGRKYFRQYLGALSSQSSNLQPCHTLNSSSLTWELGCN